MAHYEFQGTLIQCLEYIDEAFGCKDLGCKTRIVIDIDKGKNRYEKKLVGDDKGKAGSTAGEERSTERADQAQTLPMGCKGLPFRL